MSNYYNAGVGLRKMYVAAIGMIVCIFLTMIPIVNIVALIALIAFFVMDLKGYYYAGKDIDICNIAFILRIVSILLNVFGEFATIPDLLALPYGIVQTVVPVVSVCMVFYSVAEALREEGAEDIAGQGICAMWIYIGCQVATVVVEVITSAMLLSGILSYALLILLINLALSIVALVFQLRFYKKSAEQFGVY